MDTCFSYLAETPHACREKVKELLDFMLSVEGEDELRFWLLSETLLFSESTITNDINLIYLGMTALFSPFAFYFQRYVK